MAKLKVEATTWTKGKRLRPHYRLGDEQAEAEVSTRDGTVVSIKLFGDGSGVLVIGRGSALEVYEIHAEGAATPHLMDLLHRG